MRARHRAFESPPGEPHTDSNGAPLSLSLDLSRTLSRRKRRGEGKRRKEPPTLSNPKQSRPGVQGVSTLLPSSGDRLGRRTLGRTGGGRSARRDVRATKRAKSLRELARRTRSIGNDPSAGSPTETLLRLLLPLNDHAWALSRQAHPSNHPEERPSRQMPVQIPRKIVRSVVATGGVYKGQGRNRRELMTRAYWEFLVQGR